MKQLIALHFENLRLFVAQYILATIVAVAIYYYLGRTYPGKEYTQLKLPKIIKLGQSHFQTPLYIDQELSSPDFILRPPFFGDSLRNYWSLDRFFLDLSYFYMQVGYPSEIYGSLKSAFQPPHVYESNIIYQIYKIMVAITSWAGLLLVITPFSYIYVFLPHFPEPYNIIVAIVLSIAIFEGLISTIFFKIGARFVNIVLVESFVIIAFTFSLLSPSMAWIGAFTATGRLEIYLILLFMFATITALISQLKTRRNLFLSSLIFSIIAYFSFVGIVLYNVFEFL